MALRLSSALRNRLLGERSTLTDAGSQVAFNNASAYISDTGNRWLTNGFRPDDLVEVSSSAGGTNDGYYSVTSVSSDGNKLYVSPAPSLEAASAATPTIECVHGKAFRDLFHYGVLDIYSGSQPASADATESGTKLVSITVSAGAFTKGTSTNGLQFEAAASIASGVISKKAADTWQGTALATGTAGYFRYYDNAYDTGVDSSAVSIRFDGACAVSGSQLNMSSTSIAASATITIDQFDMTEPAS